MVLLSETIDEELPGSREAGRAHAASSAGATASTRRSRSRCARSRTRRPPSTRSRLWIAFDYGGRAEIVEAARRLVEDGVPAEDVDEAALAERLYAPELGEIDLLIRASGELRISNFLLWELAYAELVFTDTLWPDFDVDDLRAAVEAYAARQRRFGARAAR